MDIQVIKRDGSLEPFSKEKIDRVMVATGIDPDVSLKLANEIEFWAQSLGTDKIPSAQIRNKVVEELRKTDKYAADFYIWYEQTKK